MAADVYAHPMHVGRGGLDRYTGSAGWMYQAAVHALLGLRRRGASMSISPSIPTGWPDTRWSGKSNVSQYRFVVENPDHVSHGIARAQLDGVNVDPEAIPLADDGADHQVSVLLGRQSVRRSEKEAFREFDPQVDSRRRRRFATFALASRA